MPSLSVSASPAGPTLGFCTLGRAQFEVVRERIDQGAHQVDGRHKTVIGQGMVLHHAVITDIDVPFHGLAVYVDLVPSTNRNEMSLVTIGPGGIRRDFVLVNGPLVLSPVRLEISTERSRISRLIEIPFSHGILLGTVTVGSLVVARADPITLLQDRLARGLCLSI